MNETRIRVEVCEYLGIHRTTTWNTIIFMPYLIHQIVKRAGSKGYNSDLSGKLAKNAPKAAKFGPQIYQFGVKCDTVTRAIGRFIRQGFQTQVKKLNFLIML